MDKEKVCSICGKHSDKPHNVDTREEHSNHMTRFGWSGMCA